MGSIKLFLHPEGVYGGVTTYATHLYHSLREQSYETRLYRVGARGTVHTNGVPIGGIDINTAIRLAKPGKSLVLATDRHTLELMSPIIERSRSLVLHDTPQFAKGNLLEFLQETKIPVIAIRESIKAKLELENVPATFIPHPFIATKPRMVRRLFNAVSLSRIHWWKGTHFMVEANTQLPLRKQIHIYGQENRLYMYHSLDSKYGKKWRKNWQGPFPNGKGADIAAKYNYLVDMSTFKKYADGGGSQYTFLEAFDAGTGLILHSDWVDNDSTFKEYAEIVNSVDELVEQVQKPPNRKKILAAEDYLETHAPVNVVSKYIRFLDGN